MGYQKEKLFNIYFFVIALVNLASSVMMQMFNATIALHMDALGSAASVSGTIISIGAVSATVYRFFGGKICEKRGRRKLMVIGMADFALMSLFMGLTNALPLLYILRVLQMFGYSMASTCASVAVIDVIPQKRVGEGLGYYSLAASAAQAFGPSVALFFYHTEGGFFSVMSGMCFMGAVAVMITLCFLNYEIKGRKASDQWNTSEQENEGKGIWQYIEKRALPAAWVYFFVTLTGSLVTMYLTLFASRSGIDNAGMFFTISVVFMVAARIVSGKLSDRRGVLWAVVPGMLLLISGYMMLIFSDEIHLLFYIAGGFYGFGTGMASPALNAQAVKGVPKTRVSVASSTFFLPMDISFMAGSVLWGVMIDYFEFRLLFVMAAGLSCIAVLLSFLLFSARPKQQRVETAEQVL